MGADDPDSEIERSVERLNPRKPGEKLSTWQRRLSGIKSRALKIYWRDIEAIREEAGVETEEAREMWRKTLDKLDAERGETTREEIVHAVSEAMEEQAAAHPEREVEEASLWTGEELVFEMEQNVDFSLPDGFHEYEATMWVYKGSRLLGRSDVVFEGTPSEFWFNFHEAAREFLEETLGSDETPKNITFSVTEIRVIA